MEVEFDALDAASELLAQCFGTSQEPCRSLGVRFTKGGAEELECPGDGVVPVLKFARDPQASAQECGCVRGLVVVQCDGSERSERTGDDVPSSSAA